MPKRRVKRIPWEIESERLEITPSMARRIRKGLIRNSIATLTEFSLFVSTEDVFHAIPRAAFAALHMDRHPEAADLARRAIELAPSFEQSWNYGNALYAGHTVLGLLALKNGSLEEAVNELHASSNVRGSPQLASFGPSMLLAKELLLQGQSATVLEFLSQCQSFWKSGDLWIEVWKRKIERGLIPNFVMHLHW